MPEVREKQKWLIPPPQNDLQEEGGLKALNLLFSIFTHIAALLSQKLEHVSLLKVYIQNHPG